MTAHSPAFRRSGLLRLVHATLNRSRPRLPGRRDIRDLPDHLKHDLGLFEFSDDPGARDGALLRALRRREGDRGAS